MDAVSAPLARLAGAGVDGLLGGLRAVGFWAPVAFPLVSAGG